MDKAQGNLTYRLRVDPPTVQKSILTVTEYIVKDLKVNTNYTVYVTARSSGVYGPEVFIATTTVGSEFNDIRYAVNVTLSIDERVVIYLRTFHLPLTRAWSSTIPLSYLNNSEWCTSITSQMESSCE